MKKIKNFLPIVTIALLWACTQKEKPMEKEKLFSVLPSDSTGIDFLNTVENEKEMNIFKYRNFYNGGGVAIGDINNDGLADVYFIGNKVSNKLYLNKGNWKFEDITEKARVGGTKPWSTGVVMVDINQDGWLDIYVSNSGNPKGNNHDNELFINNGDLTFTQQAEKYNLSRTGFSTQAAFFDYDKDGDLDAYILNNSNIPVSSLGYSAHRQIRARDWNVPEVFKGVGDLLMRNDDGYFTDVTEEAGIYGSLIGFGLGVYVTDFNQDSYPDIYVSNDFYERDYLYINNQDGTFTEDIKNWTSHLCLSAMGIDMGDVNNDGLQDIFVTDMLPEENKRIKSVMQFENHNIFDLKQKKDFFQQYIQNTLQINNGNGTFSEVAYFSNIAKTDWSWAGLIFDMDNDGFNDIYVTNGINHDLTDIDFVDFFADKVVQKMVVTGKKEDLLAVIDKMPQVKLSNYAFKNMGNFTFEQYSENWGIHIPSFSNGCAYGDLDNDGDLDLVVNNVNMESFVFRNNSNTLNKNHFLSCVLKGPQQNQFGVGAQIKIYVGNDIFVKDQMPSRGFQSSMDYQLVFGLGKYKKIDSLRIIWPDDATQLLVNIPTNQTLTLDHKNANRTIKNQKIIKKTFFKEQNLTQLKVHKEDNFNDFDQEGLVESKLSQEGPSLAIGDINNDGNDDVFVGSATGDTATVYLHTGKGKLIEMKQPALDADARFEDTAAEFADIDNDGDVDLLVGSGGNNPKNKNLFKIRIYLNEGKGQFTLSPHSITTQHNISVIKPYDYDQDGWVDVFVGARSVPGVYGIDPKHLLLKNNGDGTFVDITERYAYDLQNVGMVTAANWVDFNGDANKDLIVVTDWGTPQIFLNNKKRLEKTATSLDSLMGWWYAVNCVDLDGDGDVDCILGNRGENLPYKADNKNPIKLWINDFDENGTLEQITSVHEKGKDYPIHMRKEITMQLNHLKKKNLKASDYATRTVTELFDSQVIKNTIVKKVNTMSTVLAINEGKFNFTIKKLPSRVQWSCTCDIICKDFNGDGHLDILTAGNNYDFKPQFSRLDASQGDLLLGDGKMNFDWQPYTSTGLNLMGEVKHMKIFRDKNGNEYMMVAINQKKSKVYALNP